MKKAIGKFIFDLVSKYIIYLDDEHYDQLMSRTKRLEFTRKRPLPKPTGEPITFYSYKKLD